MTGPQEEAHYWTAYQLACPMAKRETQSLFWWTRWESNPCPNNQSIHFLPCVLTGQSDFDYLHHSIYIGWRHKEEQRIPRWWPDCHLALLTKHSSQSVSPYRPFTSFRQVHRAVSAVSNLVGNAGFEPTTPCAQGRCATRLR